MNSGQPTSRPILGIDDKDHDRRSQRSRFAAMRYYFCKFYPPRPDFMRTMTDDEARLMKGHGEYLQSLLVVGKPTVIVGSVGREVTSRFGVSKRSRVVDVRIRRGEIDYVASNRSIDPRGIRSTPPMNV